MVVVVVVKPTNVRRSSSVAGKDVGSTRQLQDPRKILSATISQVVNKGKTSLVWLGSNLNLNYKWSFKLKILSFQLSWDFLYPDCIAPIDWFYNSLREGCPAWSGIKKYLYYSFCLFPKELTTQVAVHLLTRNCPVFSNIFFFAWCEWLCAIRKLHPLLCCNALVGGIPPVFVCVCIQMDLLNCCLAECCKLMWTFVFLSLCTDLALIAFYNPSSNAVQFTAIGFFFPNCGVHTFLLLLFIAFDEVGVRNSIKQSW